MELDNVLLRNGRTAPNAAVVTADLNVADLVKHQAADPVHVMAVFDLWMMTLYSDYQPTGAPLKLLERRALYPLTPTLRDIVSAGLTYDDDSMWATWGSPV